MKNKRKREIIVKTTTTEEEQEVVQSPLVALFTPKYREIIAKHGVNFLNDSDLKMFNNVSRLFREFIKWSKIKLQKAFKIQELGSVSTLKIAWDNYPWGSMNEFGECLDFTYFSTRIAETNKLELLRWAREEKRCAWNCGCIGTAAHLNNFEMVKYCVDNDCPMNETATTFAALHDNLDMLILLRENKCPWDDKACEAAYLYNRTNVLPYLIKQKAPGWERATA
jgi:hypothetical protein